MWSEKNIVIQVKTARHCERSEAIQSEFAISAPELGSGSGLLRRASSQ
jgi:hypothetical protein